MIRLFKWGEKKKDETQPEQLPEVKAVETPAETSAVAELVEVAVEAPVPQVLPEPAPIAHVEEPLLEAVAIEPVVEAAVAVEEGDGWFSKLRKGLSKSSNQLAEGVSSIFTKRKLDDDTLQELEELLIMADMGAKTAARIAANIAKGRFDKEISDQEIRQALADEIVALLEPVAKPLDVPMKLPTEQGSARSVGGSEALGAKPPHVILVVGVNGNGKTTTIGKLAKQFQTQGKSVMLCAADTFRAAAVEQLQVWGQRNNVPVIAGAHEADAASVAFQALEQAKAQNRDVLMIDTAGRLQNKANLMAELQKIVKVLQKQEPSAPHTVLLTLDATTGQNAVSQVKTFRELIGVTGLVVTKLDGSAKAGVVVALAEQFGLPIHAIGVGEGIDDLRPFTARDFAANLVGLAA